MRRSFIQSLIFLVSAFILFSCEQRSSELNDVDKIKVAEEVQKMLNDYFAAINKEGLAAELDYLDNSSEFFWVPPGFHSAISYDSVKTILEQNSSGIKSIEFYWDTLTILPLSTEHANYTGVVHGTMTNLNDSTVKIQLIETGTVVKRVSGWKLLSGQSRNL